MKNIGVICEYNPFHKGHAKQLAFMKELGRAICLMSGSYVQRGEPAILNKYVRAKAAMACGADLVLELPFTYSLRSAEGFAAGGVEILTALGCDSLCFGSETGGLKAIQETARQLLSDDFSARLKEELAAGVSFPVARQRALGMDGTLLDNPNDILAVEYCKAVIKQNSPLQLIGIKREGSYHDSMDTENPSASMLRALDDWDSFVPEAALACYENAPTYSLAAGERAVLARLRSLKDEEFEAIPFGSEGLWRKLMHACREKTTLEEMITATKSKRYTRTRVMRMILCAYLGISQGLLTQPAPYVRILAMNQNGQDLLHSIKKETTLTFLHGSQKAPKSEYSEIECQAERLYGLFSNQNDLHNHNFTGNIIHI